MNYQIKRKIKLLKPDGRLTKPGYATRMLFSYNKKHAKEDTMPLKEWNFYQFHNDKYAIQLTLGHLTYIGQMAVTLIDLETGVKCSYSTMKPFFVPELDRNPEKPSICTYENKECRLQFTVKRNKRILAFKGHSKDYNKIEIKLIIENDPTNEKMVIATPFEKPNQFYLNYKENYYVANGYAQFDDQKVVFEKATGLLDWGRGVWPYSHEWYWGSLTSHIDGVPFGFNIGWGFGNTKHATENMYFYNKKAYKLDKIIGNWDDENLMGIKHFHDTENKIQFTFTPFYDNYTCNPFVIVETHCHQVFGHFCGTVETEEGTKEFSRALGFIEHAVNRW